MENMTINSFWNPLKTFLMNSSVSYSLAKAAYQHKQIEKVFRSKLLAVCSGADDLEFPHLELSPLQYWQKNFFSIFFLSIFDGLGIPKERSTKYGLILHAIRGVVTATDNILDDEDKGSVKVRMQQGKVLPNVLSILLQNGLIHQELHELTTDETQKASAWRQLFACLHSIGKEESGEEEGIEEVLSPEKLIESIHSFRGGKLLQLAFVVPSAIESRLESELKLAREGVFNIGLALQCIDDVTDFEIDLKARNHNLLRSWIIHRRADGYYNDSDLSALGEAEMKHPEIHFPQSTSEALKFAMDFARTGFQKINQSGHPIDAESGLDLVKMMFKVRGLGHLWDLGQAQYPYTVHSQID